MLASVMVNLMWMDFAWIVSIENIRGGGLMIRNDFCFHVATRFNIALSSFRTESMMLKVKINRSWFALTGIYKPPNIPKNQWKFELSSIFHASTTISCDVIFLGDLNCDAMEPNKPYQWAFTI